MQSALNDAGVAFEKRVYPQEPLSESEIRGILVHLGLPPKELLSTRSRAYRELGLIDRDLSDDEIVELLSTNPGLFKRPVVTGPQGGFVGFSQKKVDEFTAQNA